MIPRLIIFIPCTQAGLSKCKHWPSLQMPSSVSTPTCLRHLSKSSHHPTCSGIATQLMCHPSRFCPQSLNHDLPWGLDPGPPSQVPGITACPLFPSQAPPSLDPSPWPLAASRFCFQVSSRVGSFCGSQEPLTLGAPISLPETRTCSADTCGGLGVHFHVSSACGEQEAGTTVSPGPCPGAEAQGLWCPETQSLARSAQHQHCPLPSGQHPGPSSCPPAAPPLTPTCQCLYL